MKLRKSSKDINLKIQEAYPSTRALKNILSSVFSFLCASVKRGSGLGMKIEKTLVFLEMSCGWACVLSCFSRAPLCVTLWTLARQALLSMGFSKQEHWSGCQALLQGILLILGSELLLRGIQKGDMKYYFLSNCSQIMINVCVSCSVGSDSLQPLGL